MPRDRSIAGPAACNRLMKLTCVKAPATVVIAGVGEGRELPEMRKLWPHARFVGYEPIEAFVRDDAMRSFFSDGDLHNVALSNVQSDSRKLYTNYRPDQRASTMPTLTEQQGGQTISVRSLTVADAHRMHNWQPPILFWIDVQGGEWNVLCGLPDDPNDQLFFEWINVELQVSPVRLSEPASEVLVLGENKGYSCVGIHSVSKWLDEFDALLVPIDKWQDFRIRKSRESIARQQKLTRAGRLATAK